MVRKSGNRQQSITRIICVFALLLLSFSHQPFALAKTGSSDFSAYLLPDGSLPVFCFSVDGKSGSSMDMGKCEACRLSAAINLPLAPSLAKRVSTPLLVDRIVSASPPIILHTFPPSAPPRAPPVSWIFKSNSASGSSETPVQKPFAK